MADKLAETAKNREEPPTRTHEGQNQNTCLNKGESYDWYHAIGSNAYAEQSAGKLCITRNIIEEQNEKKPPKKRRANTDKLYEAKNQDGEKFYVKAEKHSKAPLPYVLSEAGRLKANGKTYYVYERWEGDLRDLFNPKKSSRLKEYWEKIDNAEKERIAATIFLEMMFTVRASFAMERCNLDLKPANVLYRFDKHGHLVFKIIDISESINIGHLTDTPFTPITRMATNRWVSPAAYYVFHTDAEHANQDIRQRLQKACEYGDIYSVGLILYWIYSNGYYFTKEDISEQLIEDRGYQKLYYSDKNEGQGFFAQAEADVLLFADGHEESILTLIKEMLTFPDIVNVGNGFQQSKNRIEWCDDLIKEYCTILSECGRLPEMEIPNCYIPYQTKTSDCTDILLEFTISMRNEGFTNTWTEYKCLKMRDGDVCDVPVTVYHMLPESGASYRQEDDFLFLFRDGDNVYYNRILSPDERGFGELRQGEKHRYELSEMNEALLTIIFQRVGKE